MTIKENQLGSYFLSAYKLDKYISRGGNGEVYEVIRKTDGLTFALKYLMTTQNNDWTKKQKKRFCDEIITLERLSRLGNPFTMPLIDCNVSDDGPLWYIMPVGSTISDFFRTEKISFRDKLIFFIEIAKGIKSIHDLEYCHRDIKPNNILIVDGAIKLADFGLVWHPSFDPCTNGNEKIGAIETIAPEMREDSPELKHQNKADIYSFVKTVWMLLLDRNRAFVDQYSYVTKGYLSCDLENCSQVGIKTFSRLNSLIMRGTEYLPVDRPTIDEVINELTLFVLDNKLTEKEISNLNYQESIKRKLYTTKSDIEGITNYYKIKDFLDGIIGEKSVINIEFTDGQYDMKFPIKRIQASEIDGGLIIESTNNKRYLFVVSMLEIEKENSKLSLVVDEIKMDNMNVSNIYDYKDFYSVNVMDRLLGNFEEQNEKTVVEVMSKSGKFVLSIAN